MHKNKYFTKRIKILQSQKAFGIEFLKLWEPMQLQLHVLEDIIATDESMSWAFSGIWAYF